MLLLDLVLVEVESVLLLLPSQTVSFSNQVFGVTDDRAQSVVLVGLGITNPQKRNSSGSSHNSDDHPEGDDVFGYQCRLPAI